MPRAAKLPAFLLALLLLAPGCGTVRLRPADFQGRRIAAVAAFPPPPRVHHPFLARGGGLGGDAPAELRQVQRVEDLLEDAAREVDVAGLLAADVLRDAAARLGATVTNDAGTADYILDLRVHHYGLTMRSLRAGAFFFIDAEALLRDRVTQKVVWRRALGHRSGFTSRLTSGDLAYLSEAQATEHLQAFAQQAADLLKDALRKDVLND